MGIKKFTTKEYWDETRHAFSPFPVTTTPFAPYLEKYLPEKTSFRCVEIGGYPGTHLTYFAKRFGYHPTAIEYSEHWKDIQKLLEFNGITDYNIINKDFFDLGTIEPFDVVSSFGFIEHFDDYEKVLKAHSDILKPNGYLILSVPYIGGLQGIIRKLAYTPEHWQRMRNAHNEKIMNLHTLKQSVARYASRILFADYVMSTSVWFSWDAPFVKNNMRGFMKLVNSVDKKVRRVLPSSRLYSPMILVIAQK